MASIIASDKAKNIGVNLGNRSLEVRPVGVWVQPEIGVTSSSSAAARSAAVEEARIKRIQQEKANKLRKFQKDVGKRVRNMQKLKQQEQLASSCRAVEEERNIMLQSGSGRVGTFTGRSCIKNRLDADGNTRKSVVRISKDCVISSNSDPPEDSMQHVFSPRESLATRQMQAQQRTFSDDDNDDDERRNESPPERPEERTVHSEVCTQRSVHFDLTKNESNIPNRPSSAPPSARKPLPTSLVNCGVQKEEEALRLQRQRALYRRLFMDREREAVQLANRQKEEKQRILKLKSEAEKARRREEYHLNPDAPRRKEPEVKGRLTQEEQMWLEMRRSEEMRRKKITENTRYVLALKEQLRDRVKSRKLQLPPLCCCSPSPFDTDPLTCANNCPFYHNPKAHERALQALIATSDV